MLNHLDFLVVGAQKCATSWLYYCLKDHPELQLPAQKGDVEYLGGSLFEERGPDWYFGMLGSPNSHKKRGDVSVEYLFDPRPPAVVHHYAPDVKLIVSLREPIDRAISAYYWGLRKGWIPNLPLREGLAKAVDKKPGDGDHELRKRYGDFIERGFYDVQLERYLEHFRPDQFLFLLYEDIKQKPLAVLQRMYDFIGVDTGFVPPRFHERPKRNLYLGPLINFERFLTKFRGGGKVVEVASKWLYSIRIYSGRPSLPDSLREKLQILYWPHMQRTRDVIGKAPVSQRPMSEDILAVWTRGWLWEEGPPCSR